MKKKKVIGIQEKPKSKKQICCNRVYLYDKSVVEKAKNLKPSKEGNLK